MSVIAKTIFQALQPKPLEQMDHFKHVVQKVSDFRYALIQEREDLPQLLRGQTIPEIEAKQENYSKLGKTCLEWIWTCQSHIDNPQSERGYRERTKADFPTIQQIISDFREMRQSLFPEDVLPEGFAVEPSDSEPKKESEVSIFEESKPKKEPPTPVFKKPRQVQAKPTPSSSEFEYDEVEIDGVVTFLPRLPISEPA